MYKLRIKDGYVGNGVPFIRLRRITGYLVGNLDRFNTAKKKEVEDRVKHSSEIEFEQYNKKSN